MYLQQHASRCFSILACYLLLQNMFVWVSAQALAFCSLS